MDTKVSLVEVTPEMATVWLSSTSYEHQRPLSAKHLEYITEEMARGQFKQDSSIEFAEVAGKRMLIDGQHRLNAVIRSKTVQRFVIVVRTLKDLDDVAWDYTRIDQQKRRTIAQQYKVFQLSEELGMSTTWINALGAAVAFIASKWRVVDQARMHPDDRLCAMREYADACTSYIEATAGKPAELKGPIERAATLSVGLVTFRYATASFGPKVYSFWEGVAQDDALRRTDPRRAAIKHLLEVSMTGGVSARRKTAVSPAASARYLAQCFNAYIQERELAFTKVKDATKPIVILGTPFTGK